jgi:carboxypeptidase C (cathepsin A)
MRIACALFTAILASVACTCAYADDDKQPTPAEQTVAALCQLSQEELGKDKDEWRRLPSADQSVTQHRLSAGGKSVEYTATAGTLVIRDDMDKPIANMGYTAYVRRNATAGVARPIMFAFNGGPGSSSMWLHMGVLGPRRVVVKDEQPSAPAPFKVVDNEFGVLDKSDLVMIDPVGTGISRAVCNKKDEDFWGVDSDVDSIGRFIAQYVSDNQRWNSPKYLLGESYGTTRGAAIVNWLQGNRSLTFNGLILVSVATDIEQLFAELPGNERPYAAYLPGYAAVAWYHHALPEQPPELAPFLDEVRAYAMGPFSVALNKGGALTTDERNQLAAQLHKYTGLSAEYLLAANFRVAEVAFVQELLRSRGLTLGRLDARFAGPTQDLLAKYTDYDPQSAAISPAFVAAFQDYYHGELNFGRGKTYRTSNGEVGNKWKWTHKIDGGDGEQPMVNSGVDLAAALVHDANLRVLVLNGYYDLATPFSATEYMMAHLNIPQSLRAHIEMKYYPAGHMMYVHEPSMRKVKADMDTFIDSTIPRP